jgi:hypothetical protein
MYIQQCFAGRNDDLFSWFKSLYFNFKVDKEIFKQKILFDMSYGLERGGCITDLVKYRPLYNTSGENFINFGLYNKEELESLIDTSTDERMKKIILLNIIDLFKISFFNSLNMVKKEFINTIRDEYLPLFRRLKILTPNKEAIFRLILNNYDNIAKNDSGLGYLYRFNELVDDVKRIQKSKSSVSTPEYYIYNSITTEYE